METREHEDEQVHADHVAVGRREGVLAGRRRGIGDDVREARQEAGHDQGSERACRLRDHAKEIGEAVTRLHEREESVQEDGVDEVEHAEVDGEESQGASGTDGRDDSVPSPHVTNAAHHVRDYGRVADREARDPEPLYDIPRFPSEDGGAGHRPREREEVQCKVPAADRGVPPENADGTTGESAEQRHCFGHRCLSVKAMLTSDSTGQS